MALPLLDPRKVFAALAGLLFVAGCQPGQTPHPVPSVQQIGRDLNCSKGDHAFEDIQAGWGFCYPGTWHFLEHSQVILNPPGLELTFDITDVPCTAPPPGSQAAPSCAPDAGNFGFMIISTYERGSAASLTDWLQTNMKAAPTTQTITWSNAVEAARFADGRRVALTQHHV